MEQKSTDQAYAYWATTYDQDHASGGISVEEEVVMSLLPAGATSVLDAASGTGRYAVRLAQMGKHVVGVDVSEEMLTQARSKAERFGVTIDFRQASLEAMPLPEESMEAVICAMALAHVMDLGSAIREFFRVLRGGGVLIISDLHPDIQKRWGPDYTASVKDGRLLVDSHQKELEDANQCPQAPFPQYRTDPGEYVDAIRAAHGEVLAVIEIRCWQVLGLLPFFLVVLARKCEREPAVAPQP